VGKRQAFIWVAAGGIMIIG